MLLLDTDVLIDVLRGFGPAVQWLATLGDESLGVPGLVTMELVQGCRDRREQQRIEENLRLRRMFWPSEADCGRALNDFTVYHLSHNIGILDALIAHTAIGLGVPLATFNTKHYRVMRGLQLVQPYDREL